MAHPPPYPDSGDDAGVGPDREPTTGTPRWVKVVGIIALIVILLVVIAILAGGGEHGPGRHSGGGDTIGLTSPSSGHKNTGVGGHASADEADRMVEVTTLDTMAFEPSTINVSAGETVTFVVTNIGQTVHDFSLGDAAMQQEHAGEVADHEANSITLQPGETKLLTWRFEDAGTLEYSCHEPGHYQAGMRGQITIT